MVACRGLGLDNAGKDEHQLMQYPTSEELSISKIKVKGFNLGGHQIDCRIWNDYNAKVTLFPPTVNSFLLLLSAFLYNLSVSDLLVGCRLSKRRIWAK
ncbi:unnamed protein product [Urochloa humidicola]